MSERMDSPYDEIQIPINCTQEELNVWNYSLDIRGTIEGAVLAVLFTVPIVLLCLAIHIRLTYIITCGMGGIAGGLFLGINGINGDHVTTYIFNAIVFRKKRRDAIYNPRVKKEKRYFTEEKHEGEDYVIPRERLEAMYHKYISQRSIVSADAKLEQGSELDASQIVFEDDIETFGKPEDIMTKRELKKHRKEQAKQKKAAARKVKKDEKEKRKTRKVSKKGSGKGVGKED